MDVGVLVLCPEIKRGDLKHTCCSAKRNLYNRSLHCVVPKATKQKEFAYLKEVCPSISRGQNSITSLINSGLKKIKNEWVFVAWSGSSIKPFTEHKFKYADNENVLIFPVFDQYHNFIDAPFNGILFNKRFFSKVGEFEEFEDFEESKIFWAHRFIQMGGCLKGVVGLRL